MVGVGRLSKDMILTLNNGEVYSVAKISTTQSVCTGNIVFAAKKTEEGLDIIAYDDIPTDEAVEICGESFVSVIMDTNKEGLLVARKDDIIFNPSLGQKCINFRDNAGQYNLNLASATPLDTDILVFHFVNPFIDVNSKRFMAAEVTVSGWS